MKTCSRCGVDWPISYYYVAKGKPVSHCKKCHYGDTKAWRDRNRDRVNKRVATLARAKRLGMTYEEYVLLPADPGEACSVCGCSPGHARNGRFSNGTVHRPSKNLAVDHDHTTGKIRGFLCGNCNMALGLMHDNPEWCRALADYVASGGLGWEPRPNLPTGRRPSDTCGQGHALAGDNLRVLASGERRCRECVNQRQRDYQARKRANAKQ